MKSDDDYIDEMLRTEREKKLRQEQLTADEKARLLIQIQQENIEPGFKYFSKESGHYIPLWRAYWVASDGYLMKECYISSSGDLYEILKVKSTTRKGMETSIIPASPETEQGFGEMMYNHREWIERTKSIPARPNKPKWWRSIWIFSI